MGYGNQWHQMWYNRTLRKKDYRNGMGGWGKTHILMFIVMKKFHYVINLSNVQIMVITDCRARNSKQHHWTAMVIHITGGRCCEKWRACSVPLKLLPAGPQVHAIGESVDLPWSSYPPRSIVRSGICVCVILICKALPFSLPSSLFSPQPLYDMFKVEEKMTQPWSRGESLPTSMKSRQVW